MSESLARELRQWQREQDVKILDRQWEEEKHRLLGSGPDEKTDLPSNIRVYAVPIFGLGGIFILAGIASFDKDPMALVSLVVGVVLVIGGLLVFNSVNRETREYRKARRKYLKERDRGSGR